MKVDRNVSDYQKGFNEGMQKALRMTKEKLIREIFTCKRCRNSFFFICDKIEKEREEDYDRLCEATNNA